MERDEQVVSRQCEVCGQIIRSTDEGPCPYCERMKELRGEDEVVEVGMVSGIADMLKGVTGTLKTNRVEAIAIKAGEQVEAEYAKLRRPSYRPLTKEAEDRWGDHFEKIMDVVTRRGKRLTLKFKNKKDFSSFWNTFYAWRNEGIKDRSMYRMQCRRKDGPEGPSEWGKQVHIVYGGPITLSSSGKADVEFEVHDDFKDDSEVEMSIEDTTTG